MHAQHAGVAIELDREPQPSRLKPEREIPGHQRDDDGGREQHIRVSSAAVFVLVAEHQRAQMAIERHDPFGKHDLHRTKADYGRPFIRRESHGNAVDFVAAPTAADRAESDHGSRESNEEKRARRDRAHEEPAIDQPRTGSVPSGG